jgi:hypothetical protein
MGYELDQLMKQYGVSTPTKATYTGAEDPGVAPTAPKEVAMAVAPEAFTLTAPAVYKAPTKPVEPAKLGAKATAAQKTAYTTALDKYALDLEDYNLTNTPEAIEKARYQNALDISAYNQAKSTYDTDVINYNNAIKAYPTAFKTYQSDKAIYDKANTTYLDLLDKYKVDKGEYDTYAENYGKAFSNPVGGSMYGNQEQYYTGVDPFVKQDVEKINNPVYQYGAGSIGTGPNGEPLTMVGGYRGYYTDNPSVQASKLPGGALTALKTYQEANPSQKFVTFSHGGPVKTHFYTGGGNDLDGTQLAAVDFIGRETNPAEIVDGNDFRITTLSPTAKEIQQIYPDVNFDNYPRPQMVSKIDDIPMLPDDRAMERQAPPKQDMLSAMLAKYSTGDTDYASEIRDANRRASSEADAFQKMLGSAMKGGDEAPSKAEMYFRLAAAFGEPTKTGHASESIGKAGNVMADLKKEERASKTQRRNLGLQLGIEGQKLKMQTAKDEVASLRALAGEQSKDKRAIAIEMMKEYIKSGEPQSTAGKQAKDEGLTPGTPEFQKRVEKIADLNIERQMSAINAALANMSVGAANLALSQGKFSLDQAKFENVKNQQGKLTPVEVKMKSETEDTIAAADSAMESLKKAYALNPNTFDASFLDKAQRKLLEETGNKDPKVLATREQENLLTKQVLAGLKAAFGGNPTEGERDILLSVQGIGSKSKEERAFIMKDAFKVLKASRERQNKRLNEITQGLYRETSPAPVGGLE